MTKGSKKKKGFTLIEIMVTVLILVLVIGAASTAEIFYLNSATLSKHYIQADNLAEQTINLTKLVRDKNLKTDSPKDSLSNFPYNDNKVYHVDIKNNVFVVDKDEIHLDGVKYIIKITFSQ